MVRFVGVASTLLLAVVVGITSPGSASAPTDGPTRSAGTVPSAVLVAVGDIACPPGATVYPRRCQQAATARIAARLNPQRVLALGDLQYQRGNYNGFLRSYDKSWGALKSITWPLVGNHEYGTTDARGYFRYFAAATTSPGYYRRSINGWQIYVLNSNCNEISCVAERNWLKNRLATHPSKCALIAMHHPRYSSGREHGNNATMRSFWRLAQNYGVDLVLSGHEHNYERFAFMDADGNLDPTGMQQFVIGTGGKSLYPKGTSVPGSQRFINNAFGVVKLTLRPAGWSWQFRDIGFKLRDSGSSACH